MVIPQFPSFRPLAWEDKPAFDAAFASYPPVISEYTFTNLYAWREAYHLAVSSFGGFILLSGTVNGSSVFFDPVGTGDRRRCIETVTARTRDPFVRLPRSTAAVFSGDPAWETVADRDNFDYVYRVKDLVALQGKKYDGKRNFIKRFKNTYSYEYFRLTPDAVREALRFEDAWCSAKECDRIESLSNERHAFREMLSLFPQLPLVGGAMRVNGAIVAVAVGERLAGETLVMHILKAQPDIIGLPAAILHEFLAQEGSPFTRVNLEQDLGIEGLRRSKESYHPETMVEKFTLRQRK